MLRGELSRPVPSITAFLQGEGLLDAVLSRSHYLTAEITKDVTADYYQGEYVFTPSPSEQIVLTSNKLVSRDIVINPIPSDYGHISWNGSVMTIT